MEISQQNPCQDTLNFSPTEKSNQARAQSFQMDSISSKRFEVSDSLKENLHPCSKKIALFELMERQFLSLDNNKDVNHILIDQINKIRSTNSQKLNEIGKGRNEVTNISGSDENSTSIPALQNIVEEKSDHVKYNEENNQTNISEKDNAHNNRETKCMSADADQNSEGREKLNNELDSEDFEKFLDEKMKEQNKDDDDEIDTVDNESKDGSEEECMDFEEKEDKNIEKIDEKKDKEEEEEEEIEDLQEEEEENDKDKDYESEDILDFDSEEEKPLSLQETKQLKRFQMGGLVSNLLGSRSSQRKRPRIMYNEEDDEVKESKKRKVEESEEEEEESEEEYEEEEEEEEQDEEDKEVENMDDVSKEEGARPLSLMEKRRLNKMQMMGGLVANLLDSARTKMKKIAEKLESPKKEVNSNPRKIRRYSVVDQSTRALIKEITPVRRSSRQIERKYYSEGVDDPEMMDILRKLENYGRRNANFVLPLNETYEDNFLGFKHDESRQELYLEGGQSKRRHYRRVQHRSGRGVPVPSLDVSDVTDDILRKVVTHVSAKEYSKTGSTCHQCRQKTIDTKTFCRSGECTGVRGQFCGVCLLNRYGEDIVKALLDENWACPPCRDICNCSICRNRKGLPPTGILTPLALGKGYESVKDYLKEAEKDLVFVEY